MCARHTPHLHGRGHRQVPHTEELALIICTLQIYNTTIHTSVGAETQEGRSLRGLAGWPAACSPGCQPLPICKTRVSFPSPSFLTLSFFLSFFLPISVPLFASSAIPPFHLVFFFSSPDSSSPSSPTNGGKEGGSAGRKSTRKISRYFRT